MTESTFPPYFDAIVDPEDFGAARATPGVHAVHHYHALAACWRFLAAGRQRILDIGPNPVPWLKTIKHFSSRRHRLWGCLHGGAAEIAPPPMPKTPNAKPPDGRAAAAGNIATEHGITLLRGEFDIWSPLADREAPNTLPRGNFTLVTALDVVDRMYHPDLLFRVLMEVVARRGVLVISARNVARFGNILGLLRGGGIMGNIDALIGRNGGNQPRPRVREYCWQELNGQATQNDKFEAIGHHFYDDPAAIPAPGEWDDMTRRAAEPCLMEADQLKANMILLFRKPGPVGLERVLQALTPLCPGAKTKLMRMVKWRG